MDAVGINGDECIVSEGGRKSGSQLLQWRKDRKVFFDLFLPAVTTSQNGGMALLEGWQRLASISWPETAIRSRLRDVIKGGMALTLWWLRI